MLVPLTWLMTTVLLAPPAAAPTPVARDTTVLVLTLESKDVAPVLAETLSAEFTRELSRVRGLRVTWSKEVESALSTEQLKQLSQCNAVSCAAEIAGALSSDEIVFGQVARLGGSAVVHVSRVRARDALVVGRGSIRSRTETGEELLSLLGALAAEVYPSGSVAAVSTLPSRAETSAAEEPGAQGPRMPLLAAGLGGGAALAGVGLVSALLGLGAGGTWLLLAQLTPLLLGLPTPELEGTPRFVAMRVPGVLVPAVGLFIGALGLGAGVVVAVLGIAGGLS